LDHVPGRQFGNLWVSYRTTTAIDQDEASDPLWRLAVGLKHHPTAHAMSNQDGWWELQGAQERTDVGPIGFNVTVGRIALRSIMPTQIAGDHALARAKKVHLGLPIGMVTGIPMHKYQGRVPFSLPFIEESYPLPCQIRHPGLLL
jgi:hypothetical protein